MSSGFGRYFYYGPVSSFQIRGRRVGVRLIPGRQVELPRADPRVRRLVARKQLIPVSMAPEEIERSKQAASGEPSEQSKSCESSSEEVSAEEQFPASEQQAERGTTTEQSSTRRKRRKGKKGKPSASGTPTMDPDAGGAHQPTSTEASS